jgi:hypothetical protein
MATAAALVTSATAIAGPPLETDDPATPERGQWEIAFSAELEKRGSEREILPLADINYGYREDVQLKLKPRAVIADSSAEGRRNGWGNVQIGLKWRFFEDQPRGRAVSIYPQVDLNPPSSSDDRELVEDGSVFFLPLEIMQNLGDTSLYAEIGYAWREHRRDERIIGLAIEQAISSRLFLVAELRDVAEVGESAHELSTRAGFKWRLQERWMLLASIGRTLHEPQGERRGSFAYLGFQQTF